MILRGAGLAELIILNILPTSEYLDYLFSRPQWATSQENAIPITGSISAGSERPSTRVTGERIPALGKHVYVCMHMQIIQAWENKRV